MQSLAAVSRLQLTKIIGLARPLSMSSTSPASSSPSTPPYREEKIVVTEDGCVIACWHPPPKFPYEMSRPIPRNENTGSKSPLKVLNLNNRVTYTNIII